MLAVFDNAGNPGNVLFSFGAATDQAQVRDCPTPTPPNLHTHVRSVSPHTHTIFRSRRQVVAVDQDVTVINPNTKASAVQENLVGITARATAFVAEVAWLFCHG